MPVGWPPITSSIWMGASKTALNQPRIAELAELLERRPRLPLPDLLIADAHLFVRSETESDWPRAVLLAAIGTELAVKTALRDAAAPLGRLQLVQVLLENPRDFSVAAAALFDKVMAAVGRRSLREDNRDLFRGVERLFQTRNGIAHRGEMPDQATTREVVVTASEALAWLRSEETTATP